MKKIAIILALLTSPAVAETMSISPPSISQAPTSTIGALPACSTSLRGRIFIVTDALVPAALATVAAGGAVTVGVICNGTNWIVL
jgi:hypothetical protein